MLARYLYMKVATLNRSEWLQAFSGLALVLIGALIGAALVLLGGCSLGMEHTTTTSPDAGIAACPADAGALLCNREGLCTYDGKECEAQRGSGSGF
jgi:hypothetical protein